MAEKTDLVFYPGLIGAMTSNDGKIFALHVKGQDGADRMLAFDHAEIPRLIELAASQVPEGAVLRGDQGVTAFNTKSFSVGVGDGGMIVLTLEIGTGESGTGAKLSFVLPAATTERLSETLALAAAKTGSPANRTSN